VEAESDPGDQRPHRPHRLRALLLGRTETMTTSGFMCGWGGAMWVPFGIDRGRMI